MILAAEAMSPTWRMIFFGLALLLFLLAAFGATWGRVSLVAAGLAAFTVPFFWDALIAS